MSKQTKGKDIPVFTTGAPGQKSVKVDNPQGPVFSAYTGEKIFNEVPKMGTIDPSSGKVLHGGIQLEGVIMMHDPHVTFVKRE